MDDYVSHYRHSDDTFQTNRSHQKNVGILARENCRVEELRKTAYVAGLHHDDGKNTKDLWQPYFKKSVCGSQNVRDARTYKGDKVDHSTLGGLIVDSYEPGSLFSEMIQLAIFTHHGIQDSISLTDGIPLVVKRKSKIPADMVNQIRAVCENELAKENDERGLEREDMARLCREARKDLNRLIGKLKKLPEGPDGRLIYGNRDFYLGMCERLLFSALADGDVRDTVDFMEGRETVSGMTDEEIRAVWKMGIDRLEEKLRQFHSGERGNSPLNGVREEISDRCEKAAYSDCNRYRLAVPTGAGKTLSSLRFALRRALETGKRHIFYVAPFRSILEQNADEIREVMGNPDWVLEHHGDVVLEDERETWRYERLIENWDEVPVIATTAVQFFNTLLKEKKRNLRRFHSLCDSVIIFDEVQSIPDKVMGLFRMSVNFLTEICGSVVVLCTATQPLFEEMPENRMLKTEWMADRLSAYEPSFRRVEYVDATENGMVSLDAGQAADMICRIAEKERQVLAIFNTKGTAKQVFEAVKGRMAGNVFHLSTSMCPEHRKTVLRQVRKVLEDGEDVICISTQLVEAGVDFSFRSVIRSMAGLDNLIQAAGRCNRHGKEALGKVYVIQMTAQAEPLSSLPDIRKAQEAMRTILQIYHENPDQLAGRLDSEQAIAAYYRAYLQGKRGQDRYPTTVEGMPADLIGLLSGNKEFFGGEKRVRLKQAFRTAGERFSMIEDQGGVDVVAPYGDAWEVLGDLERETEQSARKQNLRKLQRYTVNLSESMFRRMGPDAVSRQGEEILVLNGRYYDPDTGVKTEAGELEFLDF